MRTDLRRLVAGAAFASVCALLLVFRVHGFSITAWHTFIDASPQEEILLGQARQIRSDDYLVIIPHILAQSTHRPAFPARNTLIGDGAYNMRTNYSVPVRDAMTLFRPQVWGYFVSDDVGLAFNWWFYVFAGWYALYALFRRISGCRPLTAGAAATALLFSPFMQYWSLNCAPSVIFAAGTLLSALRAWRACSGRRLATAALATAWFGTAFLLTWSYLPYLVVLAYLLVFLAPTVPRAPCSREHPRLDRRLRLAALAASLAAVAALGAGVVVRDWDVVTTIRNTVYPGARGATGGAMPLCQVFRSNFVALFRPPQWGRLVNVCEAAGFLLFWPLVAAALAWEWILCRRRPGRVMLSLLAYLALLTAWNLFGFPGFVTRWTFMANVPTGRSLIGIGVADALLLAAFISRPPLPGRSRRESAALIVALSAAWFAVHVVLGHGLQRLLPGYPPSSVLLAALAMAGLGGLVLAVPRAALPVLAALSLCLTAGFNPLVRGGTRFIRQNPLSRRIVTLDRQARADGRPSTWIVYGEAYRRFVTPNLPRMLGVHALNGAHAYPQAQLWQALDPDGDHRSTWNRYAHVMFSLPDDPAVPEIELLHWDVIRVGLDPGHPRFAALGADYLLYSGDAPQLDRRPDLERVDAYAGHAIYRVIRAKPPPARPDYGP